jgi:cell division septal protein FtsQ
MSKKVKVRRLNIARTLVLILIIYIIICFGIFVYKEPVRHYEINGNNTLSDVDIIRYLNLENYPSFISINTRSLKKKLEGNALVSKATIKYGWNFKLIINIEENKPVFLIKSENKLCLSDGTKIDELDSFVSVPTLLNSTPETIMKELASNLASVDEGILSSISEIEYQPSYSKDNKVIDEKRFLLYMNDNNLIYITSNKATRLNKYLDIIATDKITGNGILYLDGDEDGYLFDLFES